MLARGCVCLTERWWLPRVFQGSGTNTLRRSLATQLLPRNKEPSQTSRVYQRLQCSTQRHRLSLFSWSGTRTANADIIESVNDELKEVLPSKVFAVVHISGRQFKIAPNDLIVINRIQADVGAQLYLEKVLLAGTESATLIGTPLLSKDVVRVSATVIEHNRSAKVIVFKKKRRKNYKRKKGHRQDISMLRINSVDLSHVSDH